jgi:methionyl-tRNA formyltransferase
VIALGPEGIAVAAARGSVVLQTLQRPGGKRLAADDFLRGFALAVGMQFDSGTPSSDATSP